MVILRLRVQSAVEWKELAPSESVNEPIFVNVLSKTSTLLPARFAAKRWFVAESQARPL